MSRNALSSTKSLSRVVLTVAGVALVGLAGCGDAKPPVDPAKADAKPAVVEAASKTKKNARPAKYTDEDSSAHLRRKNAQAK